ncbi:hypothetical protein J2S43_005249 [Catenuloplanes nepalensis]|uniref:Uncharacterized protein n=1 Tax=Catenuloplanes nepalensis TaxID=587533 RepID=A0ABT9MZ65_9ACTN|nr:hypothetical protein [Catenuloplanes nepalensis]MDP9796737.1 hypothetical protein [Catenuloplanes nepalensis]
MITQRDACETELVELTPDEERVLLEDECQRLLGISVEEFTNGWRSGAYRDNTDPKVTQVAMLLPDAW